MTAPSKQLDQFVLRLPEGMRERIKAAAEANNRSMNAEILARLEITLSDPFFSDRSVRLTESSRMVNRLVAEVISGLAEQLPEGTTFKQIAERLPDPDAPDAEFTPMKSSPAKE